MLFLQYLLMAAGTGMIVLTAGEAAILKQNPLLIDKIVAEHLSDKLQIMMVPADGKFFFANNVLRSMNVANQGNRAEPAGGRRSRPNTLYLR